MKVLSLFSGIGAFEKALDRLHIPYELVAYCEIDKYASKSYSAIHGVDESMNLGDITKVDEKKLPKGIDLLTYGFPCQDISISGNQKGLFNDDGTRTRSGLFFDALRIIAHTQPKIAIAENVKNLTGKKFSEEFKIVLKQLENVGYFNYWKVLNAKDYGMPQNRERVFIVSIRKDIDSGLFHFPHGYPLEKRMIDFLEDEVDEKYFLNQKQTADIKSWSQTNRSSKNNGVRVKQIAQMYSIEDNPQSGRIYDPFGLCPTLDTVGGGNRMPKITSETATAVAMRGRYSEDGTIHQHIETSEREYANTITTVQKDSMVLVDNRIRKLTPKECFRLMGFEDADFEKARSFNKDSQLYKQAGNSIVVDVIKHILLALIDCGVLQHQQAKEAS